MEPANQDFKVSVKHLQKQFLCNICFNDIEDCFITRCGHVYCSKCITEAINRHHRCPFCNVALTENDVFKNYHFNNLRKIVQTAKAEAAQQYLDKIFDPEGKLELAKQADRIDSQIEEALIRPVEKQLVDTAKQSLLVYRKYMKDAYTSLSDSKPGLESKSIFEEIHKLILPHVKSPLLSPMLIPKKVSLVLQTPGLALPKPISLSLEITSLTPVEEIVKHFQLIIKEHNIRTIYPSKFGRQGITLSFVGIPNLSPLRIDQLVGEAVTSLPTTVQIPVKLSEFTLSRSTECFTYKWSAGKSVNYFSCKQCNLNWICETCKDHCHEGHATAPQLKDHVPTWACCYCVSKFDCKALNKNSQ